ncbi:hypothetical protein SEUCBS139899_001987 [Sporothrix eucalyptigena]|uniref:Zn(2)-C6 fungal-type domain-containing protein n=1 Tax=Sporothrix eucalyptigena TaxID=1812306 RepID=A0ABP0CK98_9PEZI
MAGTGDQQQQRACRNCTAGRISCDFVKPQCTSCQLSGRQCTGAGRALVFKTTSPWTAKRRQAASTSTQTAFIMSAPSTTTPVTQSRAAASLTSTAEQDRHVGFFWNVYLPNGERFPDEASQYTTCGWTCIARDICDKKNDEIAAVVRLAITANSLCMLGSQHREPHMIKDGQKVYGKALLHMRSALQRPPTLMDNKLALIIASRLLTVFTILFGGHDPAGQPTVQLTTQGKAWAGLNSGEMALVLSSPPAAYQGGGAHQVFVDTRLNLFLPSLIAKARTTLAEPAWMTEPWCVVLKTPLDQLVDLLAHIPALAEDMVVVNTSDLSKRAKTEAKRALRPRFLSFAADMRRWFDNVVPSLGMDELLASHRKSRKKKTTIDVLDLAKAHTLIVFWATVLHFRRGSLQELIVETEELPSAFVNVQATRYNMLKVLSSVFFPSGSGSGSSSSSRGCWYSVNMALFPLRTLLGTIGDNSADGEQFPLSPTEVELMTGIANECKARGVASFLDSMGRYVSAADGKD